MLEGPVAGTILALSAPTFLLMVIQVSFPMLELYLMGKLGSEELAAITLVFPFVILITSIAAGGLGAGITATVARAASSGDPSDIRNAAVSGLLIAVIAGGVTSGVFYILGPVFYRALGADGTVLELAVRYSNFYFFVSIAIWVFNALSAILRGIGDMIGPARVVLLGAAIVWPLSPAFMFGLIGFPRIGMLGGVAAIGVYYCVGVCVLYARANEGLAGGLGKVKSLRGPFAASIIKIGSLSSLMTVLIAANNLILTGVVATAFGTPGLAGFGVAARLDYVLVPLLFGVGSTVIAMVSVNVGAGKITRAYRIIWWAVFLVAVPLQLVGTLVAVFPHFWTDLFGLNAAAEIAAANYLSVVGYFYGLLGASLILVFAGQGLGDLRWAIVSTISRVLTASAVALLVVEFGWTLSRFSFGVGASYALSATILLLSILWSSRRAMAEGMQENE